MFGIGKIFDSVFGKFFDSIGMGWLGQAIALTADIMSGNWVGAAQDVFNLVAEFTDSSWMDRVASLQPLGAFDGGGCFGDILSENTFGRLLDLTTGDEGRGLGQFFSALNVVQETLHNGAMVSANRRFAMSNQAI
jgi:hypothetical protein